MNADHVVQSLPVSKEIICIGLIQTLDPSSLLPQPMFREPKFTAGLQWQVNRKLHTEEPDIEFFLTTYKKLLSTIQGLFAENDIQIIQSKNIWKQLQ